MSGVGVDRQIKDGLKERCVLRRERNWMYEGNSALEVRGVGEMRLYVLVWEGSEVGGQSYKDEKSKERSENLGLRYLK